MGAKIKAAEDKPARIKEAQVLKAVRKYLCESGWYVIRFQQGLGCHRGLADLGALKDGRWIFIECKKPSGRLSPAQEKFRQQVETHGGEYRVVRSLEDVADLGPLRSLWSDGGEGVG